MPSQNLEAVEHLALVVRHPLRGARARAAVGAPTTRLRESASCNKDRGRQLLGEDAPRLAARHSEVRRGAAPARRRGDDVGRRVVAVRRQDGRERQGGRGRLECRREEDETHASWRHRCQSRPLAVVLFWANGLQGNFLRVKSASNELCSMIHCKVGTRVASYWYRFANARPQNSQKLAWLASCKTLENSDGQLSGKQLPIPQRWKA